MGIPMNQQPTYLTLIQSLLNSPKDEQITILQNNLELIDDNFARILREWATQTIAEMESEEATNITINILNFCVLIHEFLLGSKSSNMEIAIAGYEMVLQVFNRDTYAESWALIQNILAAAYSDRIKFDRGENIEKAIECYLAALEVRTRDALPQDWADTQNNLAIAYKNRIKFDPGENIEKAIECYLAALEVRTRDALPQQWADTQICLGNAYKNRIKFDRGENIEKAIKFHDAALEVYTRQAFPEQWAMTQNNLGSAYSDRIKFDPGENIEKAIACYKLALEVYTRAAFPQYWAMTQNNLAAAYSDRIREDKAQNLEKAIACYKLALLVRTRADFPQDWAQTQNNLAAAYSDRIREDKAENIEKAIACYKLALLVRTRADFPQDWAATQNNLATAYYFRIREDKAENIEKAIACYDLALEVYTRAAFPQEWAMTQNNLANAYRNRIREDKAQNLEKAIACYKLALLVRTRADFPQDWAATQNNLANAYRNRIREDKAENIERAIACFELALEVHTRAAFPQEWAMTQENIAYAYQEKGLISEAIKCFKSSLEIFKPDALPLSCLEAARSLGNLGFAESLWETAIFGYEKAIEAVEQSREWIASDNRKREIIEENLNVYEKMMQSCINHQQYHKAIQTIERSKSRYLIELFTNSEIYPKTATETEKQQLKNLRRQIAASQQSLETQTPSPTLPPPVVGAVPPCPPSSPSQRTTQTSSLSPESFQQQKDNLETKLQQLAQLLEQIKQREPEFTLTQKVEPIDIAEFQKTLDTKTAIIEWYIGNSPEGGHGGTAPTGFAFIITRDNIELVTYTTTQITELETWKNNYLEQYRGDEKQNRIWQHTLSTKLQKLSEILQLNEIVAHIPPDCQQLILVPHRYLHLFPLHALEFTSEGGHGTAPRRYLLDCFPNGVKYAPSLQLLKLVQTRIKTRTSPPPEHQPLFAIQNPTEDLSNADMEVATIKTRFTSHDILINKQATKIAFTENRETISNASYIHFACHGLFNFDNPLLSLLALADSIEQTNNQNADDRAVIMRDGRKAIPEKCLTLQEIFAELNLSQCRLVTLSACETGLTNSIAITDEYIGLPSGFLYAGSLNVVSTLWSVDDLATAIFMIKFYQELHHERSVAVAVNAAQNWMRAVSKQDLKIWVESLKLDETWMTAFNKRLSYWPEDKPPFRNPKFWAAFCATGY